MLELAGPVLLLGSADEDPASIAQALRGGESPLLARISLGRVVVDPRTLADDELDTAAKTIAAALTVTA